MDSRRNGNRGRGNFNFQVDQRQRNNQRIGIYSMAALFLLYCLWRVFRHFRTGETSLGIFLFGLVALGGGAVVLLLISLWYYRHPPVVEEDEEEAEEEIEAWEKKEEENEEKVEAKEKERVEEKAKKEIEEPEAEEAEGGHEGSITDQINAALNKLDKEDAFVDEDEEQDQ